MSESVSAGPLGYAGPTDVNVPSTIGAAEAGEPVAQYTAIDGALDCSVGVSDRVETGDAISSKVMADLTAQLAEFEAKHTGADPSACKPMIDHFESIIQSVDSMSDDAKARLKDDLSKNQLHSISAMTRVLKLDQAIDAYIKTLEPSQQLEVENITAQLMDGSLDATANETTIASLAAHESLAALVCEHAQAAKIVEENEREVSEQNAVIASLRNLRTSVRLLIAQAYSRTGLLDLAQAVKKEAGLLDITGPWITEVKTPRKSNGRTTARQFDKKLDLSQL
jgi:hypothetical protein